MYLVIGHGCVRLFGPTVAQYVRDYTGDKWQQQRIAAFGWLLLQFGWIIYVSMTLFRLIRAKLCNKT